MWWPQIVLTFEQRQFITRTLCWFMLAAAIALMFSWCAWVVVTFVLRDWESGWRLALPILTGFLVYFASAALIAVWRSCDRCEFHLYPINGPRGDGTVYRSLTSSRNVHHEARRFLGSYRWGVVVSMATKGRARCMWCGHVDGAKLDGN